MKILLVAPKFYNSNIDISYWNFYFPLKDLGHEVKFFDTSFLSQETNFQSVYDEFKPELIFVMPTGDKNISPYENLEHINEITQSEECTTFCWFSDDIWRFNNWSSKICHNFNYCSTTEPSYIEKFKSEANYNNIILSGWHTNPDLYSIYAGAPKTIDISFIGALYGDRLETLTYLHENGLDVKVFKGLSFEDMLKTMSTSKISLSFMRNPNGNELQMKARPFEIAAANSCLITEYNKDLELYFTKNKEFLSFKSKEELLVLLKKVLDNPRWIVNIAARASERYRQDHTSQQRLASILEAICK
jgi:spore maturation protein CgeB